jgi:putative MATE family efflux protein
MIWPAAASSICFSLIEVVDTAMLGMVGAHAMAGTALAVTIIYLLMAFPMYLLRAATPLASALVAQGDTTRMLSLIRLTLVTAILLGAASSAAVLAVAEVLPVLGYEPQLVAAARSYMVWRGPLLAVELAFFGGWALLEGLAGTRAPLVAGLACNVVNVLLNLALIPGLGGLPALGAQGAALATSASMLVGLGWIAVATNRELGRRFGCGLGASLVPRRRADGALGRRFLRIGWPLGLAGLLDVSGWLVIGLLIPRLGTAAAAAHTIVGQLITLGLATAHGSSVAAVILVARAIGRGDAALARARSRTVLRLQLMIGGVIGAGALCCGGGWVSLFTSDAQVAQLGAALLPLGVAIIVLEGLAVCAAGVIEGTGRTRVLLVSTLAFDIVLGLAAAALIGRDDLTTLYAVWVGKDVLKVVFLVAISRRCVARAVEVGSDLRWAAPVAPDGTASCSIRPPGSPPRRALAGLPSSLATLALLELTWWMVPDG